VWLRRYQQTGLEGLRERSRAPHQPAHQTGEEIEKAVLELRQAHMRWGPRKLKRVLERDQSERRWPAPGAIGTLLKREGLVVRRRKRCKTEPTASRWRMPMVATGCGALISRVGFATATVSASIR